MKWQPRSIRLQEKVFAQLNALRKEDKQIMPFSKETKETGKRSKQTKQANETSKCGLAPRLLVRNIFYFSGTF